MPDKPQLRAVKASELRIGNWVSTPNSQFYQVTGFDIYKADENTESGLYAIPITERLLVKFGATYSDVVGSLHHDRFKLIWKESYKFWYVVDKQSLTYLTKIEYLHEWQNFVFVMNGHELTIEL